MQDQTIKEALKTVSGATFASITYKTDVAPSASNKHISITKRTTANIQLFNNLTDYNVYERAVKRSANKIEENDTANVESFTANSASFTHDEECFSIVKNKKSDQQYLYAIYNSVSGSQYYINGEPASKEDVAQYLTPSASKKLLGDNEITYNQTNDIVHDVVVRTIKLENIEQMKVCGQIIN